MPQPTAKYRSPAMAAIFLFGFLLLFGTACEKDDICVDGDTPLLIIRFYDQENPETVKNVTRLRVIGLGNGTPITTFSDRANRDSVGIPLRTDTSQTGLILIFNSQDDADGVETGNRDTIYFNYELAESFVSRACGFVPNFEGLEYELPVQTEPWIDSVSVLNPSVRTLDNAHVAIFH